MTWQPDAYNVVTNHHHRPVLNWSDLTPKEQGWFDYISERGDVDGASFFRYRGSVYDLGDGFEVAPDSIRALGFDGWQTQSYFDGIAVRWFDEDGNYHGDESVVVAHIHW